MHPPPGLRVGAISLTRFMARPRKLETARRTRRLIVRTTDEDQVRISANAQNAGLRVSEYIRRVAVDGHIILRQQSGYGIALAVQLRRIGVNLNQLTRVANTEGELPEELARLLPKIETILDRVLRME